MKPVRVKYVYITAPNGVDTDILGHVMRRMQVLGPPVIRAVPFPGRRVDHWLALGGSHRITAAKKLGLAIIIRPMLPDQRIRHDINWGSLSKRTSVKKVAEVLMKPNKWRVKHRVAALIIR